MVDFGWKCSVNKELQIRSVELNASRYQWGLPSHLGSKHLPEKPNVPLGQLWMFPNNQKRQGHYQSLWW